MSKRILSIDDSKSVHAFLTECLKESNYELKTAPNGEAGLDVLRQSISNPFDLILLDWEMPGLTGPEVLDKIQELQLKTPVIMLTSKNNTDDILSMLDRGATEYVLKPFTREIITEKIKFVIGE